MIEWRRAEHGWAPLARCDYCGELITDGKAAILWDFHDERTTTNLKLAHKGRCDPGTPGTDARRSEASGWDDFDEWIVNLARNSGVDLEKAMKRSDQTLEFFGGVGEPVEDQ